MVAIIDAKIKSMVLAPSCCSVRLSDIFPDGVSNLFLSTDGLLTFRRTNKEKERSPEIIKNIEFAVGNKRFFATMDDVKRVS